MENASKALIIAAEILIGVLILTAFVFIFRAFGAFSDTVNENIEVKNVTEFNTKFEIYNGRKDLTAQDLITIGNLAKQYNQSDSAAMTITVTVSGIEARYMNLHTLSDELSYEFIHQYSVQRKIYFECSKIEYNENTGKIDKVSLKKAK